MAKRTKPNYQVVWASLGDNAKPLDSYIEAGWLAVKPPRQYMNWIQNRQDNMLAYLNQAGVPEWDSSTDYEGGFSYVQGSDNLVYKCLADNGPSFVGATGKNPTVQPANAAFWEVAFANKADHTALAATVATHTTQIGNGSGVTDAPAWRTELGVYSTSEVDAKFAAGTTIKSVFHSFTTTVALSTQTPFDGTKPQNTEGQLITSASITPTSATNKIRVTATVPIRCQDGYVSGCIIHLHRDSVADAFVSRYKQSLATDETSNDYGDVVLMDEFVAGTTSAITINLRAGREGATDTVEIAAGALDGTNKLIILLEEVVV